MHFIGNSKISNLSICFSFCYLCLFHSGKSGCSNTFMQMSNSFRGSNHCIISMKKERSKPLGPKFWSCYCVRTKNLGNGNWESIVLPAGNAIWLILWIVISHFTLVHALLYPHWCPCPCVPSSMFLPLRTLIDALALAYPHWYPCPFVHSWMSLIDVLALAHPDWCPWPCVPSLMFLPLRTLIDALALAYPHWCPSPCIPSLMF